MEVLRKRNTATTVWFPMIEYKKTDFLTTWTPASGDVTYIKDGVNGGNTTNLPTHIAKGIYELDLVAGEVDGETTVIVIVDAATKDVEDQAVIISTYGDDSSQLSLNTIADFIIRRTFQNACDSTDGDTKTGRSLLGAIAKLVNRISSSGGTLTVYEDDDSTSLFTQTVTTSGSADPITQLDTD